MNSKARFAACGLLLWILFGLQVVVAQEPLPSEETEPSGDKLPFALYVEAGWGSAEADTINSSLRNSVVEFTDSSLDLDDQDFGRAAIGWKLPYGKGDFRLIFSGFNETSYEFNSFGRQGALGGTGASPQFDGNPTWWTLRVRDGALTAERNPPLWVQSMDDADGDGAVDPSEVRYAATPDRTVSGTLANTLQNQIQTWDVFYGRTWGKRRFTARWWGGLRYYEYGGNVLVGAWLAPRTPGFGFTDGAGIRLLDFTVAADGIGPSGALETHVNFFDGRLSLYAHAQAAFLVSDISTDSGRFFTLTLEDNSQSYAPSVSQLSATRSKSTWQDAAEVGARFALKNGVQFELAFARNGFLDVLLLPTQVRIPQNISESAQGSSALYNTQDYVLDSLRFGVSYQF